LAGQCYDDAVTTGDEPKNEKQSRKERARQIRREAYQRAKERLAKDPKHQARKEAAKQYRRATYQAAKERKKALTAVRKEAGRKEGDQKLKAMVTRATKSDKREDP
jgi:hypothetical protein